jgi:hypothetical protein
VSPAAIGCQPVPGPSITHGSPIRPRLAAANAPITGVRLPSCGWEVIRRQVNVNDLRRARSTGGGQRRPSSAQGLGKPLVVGLVRTTVSGGAGRCRLGGKGGGVEFERRQQARVAGGIDAVGQCPIDPVRPGVLAAPAHRVEDPALVNHHPGCHPSGVVGPRRHAQRHRRGR